jgi:hypothetical protein
MEKRHIMDKFKFSIFSRFLQKEKLIFVYGAIIIISLFILSLGQTARWDYLDQISMADRFEKFNTLYPNFNDVYLTGTSVYFPGISFVVVLLKKIIPDEFLILTIQVLASLSLVVYFFIHLQICNNFCEQLKFKKYFYFAIIYFLFFNYDWILYAVELKPDVFAFNLGSLGILLSGIHNGRNQKNILYLIIGAILSGSAIIFKQQYVFFLFGLLLFAIFNKGHLHRLFVLLTLIFSFLFFYIISEINNFWFWTITVVQDDGFLDLNTWFNEHLSFFKLYFFGIIILSINFIFYKRNILKDEIPEEIPDVLLEHNSLKYSVWPYVIFSVFLGALISSAKVGGNSGNTALGFSVLLPIVFFTLNKYFSSKRLFFIFILVFSIKLPLMVYSGIIKYKSAMEFSSKVQDFVQGNKNDILTGSNVYYSTRILRNQNEIINYWMYSIRDNKDVYDYLVRTSKIKKFDYLIVENWPQNKRFISNNPNYKILFENDLGIIAKRIN